MIKSSDLINEINTVLKRDYPIEKTTFKNISELSHFNILNMYEKLYFPFKFDINGKILNSKYKSYQIIKVNNQSWNKYLLLYLSFHNFTKNPCVSPECLYNLHKKNKIDILCINTIIIKYKNIQTKIDIKYQQKQLIKWSFNNINVINKENHFYFSSFDIDSNKEQIRTELMRLFINRNNYKSIHIHLENNGGGDSAPGQLLIKCLLGNIKEPWMKDAKKNDKGKIVEWNSWMEYENKTQNYDRIKLLDLDFIPSYTTKYSGKIHLYMNYICASSAWYTITYLIYGFSSKIKRYTKECYGQTLKFGTVSKDSQLVLHGQSSSCSGDGNCTRTTFHDMYIKCPTIQFYTRSFDEIDWNRFWLEN
jgi:hypothetical protein